MRSVGLGCVLVLAIGASLWAWGAEAPPERWVVLHCGALLAVPGEAPLTKASVVVKRGRIDAVLPGFVAPPKLPGARGVEIELVDLSKHFVLPGLIDAHTHIPVYGIAVLYLPGTDPVLSYG